MKKSNIRTFLFSLLAIISIASYTYLTCVTTSPTSANTTEEVEEIDNTIYLPDVAFIQGVFTISKRVLDKAL